VLIVLLPFFLLTSALGGGLAYFLAGFIFPEATTRQVRRARNLAGVATLLFPALYFGLYMMAQPKEEGDPEVTADIALIPAVWIGLCLLGVAIGLHRALLRRQRPKTVRR
jgi:formate-dependent nitrite reductase membrane component NrfD